LKKTLIFGSLLILTSALTATARKQPLGEQPLARGEHHVKVNGVNLWYVVEGSGPSLVLQAPSWGIGSAYLRNGLSALSKHFTVICYDPRGSGHSERPDEPESMSTMNLVDDLESLRKYWGLKTITLVGHSVGGAIALGYAIQYPNRVRRLILVDSSIEGLDTAREVQEQLDARRSDPRFADAVAAHESEIELKTDLEFQAFLNRILPLYFYDPARGIPRFRETWTSLPSSWTWNAYLVATSKMPLREADHMDRVQASTLILEGRHDFVCPVSIAERIHKGVRRSQLVIFERSGHLPWIEEPQAFFDQVVAFAK